MAAISQLMSLNSEAKIADVDDHVEVNTLPPGKRYHYFGELVLMYLHFYFVFCYLNLGSHKKEHSVFFFVCSHRTIIINANRNTAIVQKL